MKAIKRYEITCSQKEYAFPYEEDENGEWLKVEDVKQRLNDLMFLLGYEFITCENNSYEEIANQEFYETCNRYNLDNDEEYSDEEIIQAIFGSLA